MREKSLCPISHKRCQLCALHRGRHYYSLTPCKEYLRHLHSAVGAQNEIKKGERTDIIEGAISLKILQPPQKKEGGKTSGLPKLKVSKPWYPFEETLDLDDGRRFPFGYMSVAIVVVEGQIVQSYEELLKLAAQDCYQDKEFLEVLIGPIAISGG